MVKFGLKWPLEGASKPNLSNNNLNVLDTHLDKAPKHPKGDHCQAYWCFCCFCREESLLNVNNTGVRRTSSTIVVEFSFGLVSLAILSVFITFAVSTRESSEPKISSSTYHSTVCHNGHVTSQLSLTPCTRVPKNFVPNSKKMILMPFFGHKMAWNGQKWWNE